MPLYTFKCSCGETKESLVKYGVATQACENCEGTMVKVFEGGHFDRQKLKVFMRGVNSVNGSTDWP